MATTTIKTSNITNGSVTAEKLSSTAITDKLGFTPLANNAAAVTADRLTTARTISIGGDASGSVLFDGSSDVTLNIAVGSNSVVLGTDTVGDYVASINSSLGTLSVIGSGESASVTIDLPNTGVNAGTYGLATTIPSIVVDAQGRITSATQYGLSTSNIVEGTNLFYTNERVDDRVSNLLVAGSNISLSYDDGAGTLTISSEDDLSNNTTDNLAEGITNLYFTNTRARESISVTDSGGDGSLSYDNTTGMITYTGPSATEVRAHFSAGTGVTLVDGAIAIGQAVGTTDSPTFSNVTISSSPTNATHAATKQYVDTIASASLHYHAPVRVESPTALNATYDNGTNGVGATLTNAGTQAELVIDGVALNINDRVLIYTQTNAVHNGVYTVTGVGSSSSNWILTRATDTDSYGSSDPAALGTGDAFYVKEGATGAGELYVMNTPGEITFGTTEISFIQISSAAIYSAGTGLALNGTQFSNTGVLSVNSLTGAITSTNLLDAIKTVDGADSGLDADLLDGQNGSYYLDWTNVTNKPDPVITVSGDVTGSVTLTDLTSGTLTATLANSGVTAGTYGSSSSIPAITVDAKGRVTSVSTNSLSTTNVTEGTNLYYTDARVQTYLTNNNYATTSSIGQASTDAAIAMAIALG